MALGSMSYVEARGCADELNKSSRMMDQYFNNLRSEMNSLETVLRSNAGDQLYMEYKGLEAKLNGFPTKIREFETFLRRAVEQYENDDAALNSEVH